MMYDWAIDDVCDYPVGMPNSVEEIEHGLGAAEIAAIEYEKRKDAELYEGLTYWLDNCGGDEDHSAEWYCAHCDQEECGKRCCRVGIVVEEDWNSDYTLIKATELRDGRRVWRKNDKDEWIEVK